MICHFGVENLINHNEADEESHGGAHAKDEVDRSVFADEQNFLVHELFLGQDLSLLIEHRADLFHRASAIGSRFQPDQPDIHRPRTTIRAQPQKVGWRHVQIAVRVDRDSDLNGADDSHFAEIDFHIQKALLLQKPEHRAIVLAAQPIKQNSIRVIQLAFKDGQSRQVHHGSVGINTIQTDRKLQLVPGISKPSLSHVHFSHIDHSVDGTQPVQQTAGKGRGREDGLGARTNDDQICSDAAGNGHAVVHRTFPDPKLHQHQHHGNHHTRSRHHQFDALMCELSPRKKKAGKGHCDSWG